MTKEEEKRFAEMINQEMLQHPFIRKRTEELQRMDDESLNPAASVPRSPMVDDKYIPWFFGLSFAGYFGVMGATYFIISRLSEYWISHALTNVLTHTLTLKLLAKLHKRNPIAHRKAFNLAMRCFLYGTALSVSSFSVFVGASCWYWDIKNASLWTVFVHILLNPTHLDA